MPPRKPKKARWCRVKNERNTSHSQVPATPNSFPTAVSEHGGVLIPNIPILCDDVVRRIDVGVQTISDWCNTESILSGVDVSIQTESHCVCRCDSHVVHHVSNTDSNTYNDRLEECRHHSYDEEYLPLRDMEVHDNQAGSCTQDDAILSDPDFSYESQADDTMSFSSIANSPPTGFAVPEIEDSQFRKVLVCTVPKFAFLLLQKGGSNTPDMRWTGPVRFPMCEFMWNVLLAN
ncbi:hypothetical protein EMCRGX_G005363 [Ephydatia muelleri]